MPTLSKRLARKPPPCCRFGPCSLSPTLSNTSRASWKNIYSHNWNVLISMVWIVSFVTTLMRNDFLPAPLLGADGLLFDCFGSFRSKTRPRKIRQRCPSLQTSSTVVLSIKMKKICILLRNAQIPVAIAIRVMTDIHQTHGVVLVIHFLMTGEVICFAVGCVGDRCCCCYWYRLQ